MSRSVVSAAFVCFLSTSAAAYGGGEGGGGGGNASASVSGLSASTTKSAVRSLNQGTDRCARLPKVYRFDCFGAVYGRSAKKISGNPAYKDAATALSGVARTLDAAVAKYRDPTQPVSRRGLETYRPIKPSAVPKVTRQAEQAISKARTKLLRSPSNKREHYAKIAEAVNSSKVLLRSAFLEGGILRFAMKVMALAPDKST
ncbi:hypothetical protein [Roseobacter sp. SK209-2-6]|uniref:hypothetical protein n=1 Tax=Roseobacter sp. SK209-2-6 TaxID=388739 RepID=UPI0012F4F93E|nr:hypothetical protein [Roseobacter sp. SK209-2-6]